MNLIENRNYQIPLRNDPLELLALSRKAVAIVFLAKAITLISETAIRASGLRPKLNRFFSSLFKEAPKEKMSSENKEIKATWKVFFVWPYSKRNERGEYSYPTAVLIKVSLFCFIIGAGMYNGVNLRGTYISRIQ